MSIENIAIEELLKKLDESFESAYRDGDASSEFDTNEEVITRSRVEDLFGELEEYITNLKQ